MRSSWGGAHRPHAIPAVGDLQARRRFRRRRPASTSGIRCRMRWPRPRKQLVRARAGSAACAGPMRCARRHNVDCTIGAPDVTKPIGEWLRAALSPAPRRKLTAPRTGDAGLAAAGGRQLRPGVPDAEELLRHQGIQFLRSLCAVRRPSRPTASPSAEPFATPWSRRRATHDHGRRGDAAAPDAHRTSTRDKIDGKAGMLTRAALGAYQKATGLKVDCWPTEAVLAHMRPVRNNHARHEAGHDELARKALEGQSQTSTRRCRQP